MSKAVEAFGRVDVLVNNAGYQKCVDSIDEISVEDWNRHFAVNVHAMFYIVKAALPHMPKGGSIVNTASMNAKMPMPRQLAYSSTKAAITNFTANLAQILAPRASAPTPCCPAHLDAADHLHHEHGGGRGLRQAGPDGTSGSARGAGTTLRDARVGRGQLRLGRHDRRHGRGRPAVIVKAGIEIQVVGVAFAITRGIPPPSTRIRDTAALTTRATTYADVYLVMPGKAAEGLRWVRDCHSSGGSYVRFRKLHGHR